MDDWELVEQVWAHANRTQLSADLSQTPLLLVERAYNTPKYVLPFFVVFVGGGICYMM